MTAVQRRAPDRDGFATFELSLRLDLEPPVTGWLDGREFCGWLDLMSAIDALRAQGQAIDAD